MSEIPSEKTQAKAAEYLLSGRVKVQSLTVSGASEYGPVVDFLAHVSSASQEPGDPYYVKFNANGWHCDCPARVQICAHILACQTITSFSIPENPPAQFTTDPDIDALLGNL